MQFAICNFQFAIKTLFFAVLFLLPARLSAQVVRLPAVAPEEQRDPLRLALHPDSSAEVTQAPGQVTTPGPEEPALPKGARSGFFQKALFYGTYLPGGGERGFGQNDLQAELITALPCPTVKSPLVMTSGFAGHYLDGPQGVDLPPRLYEAYMQFRWMAQVTPQLGLDFALTPGVWSDFEQSSGKAFRMPGHGAAAWTYNEHVKLVLGAAYLARPDVDVIPIGGIIWMPSDDVKYELLFPYPRIARRLLVEQLGDCEIETWAYFKVEFLGDAWAIRLDDDTNDVVLLRDWRFILGIERTEIRGLGVRLEVGYVLGRHIQFSGSQPDFDPTDTFLLRGVLMY
ncbi:MAG: hypothetical protein JXB10_19870 [Pirellulales bacterium]|nr:hypothetical protein [Pirellulales bacterium]